MGSIFPETGEGERCERQGQSSSQPHVFPVENTGTTIGQEDRRDAKRKSTFRDTARVSKREVNEVRATQRGKVHRKKHAGSWLRSRCGHRRGHGV